MNLVHCENQNFFFPFFCTYYADFVLEPKHDVNGGDENAKSIFIYYIVVDWGYIVCVTSKNMYECTVSCKQMFNIKNIVCPLELLESVPIHNSEYKSFMTLKEQKKNKNPNIFLYFHNHNHVLLKHPLQTFRVIEHHLFKKDINGKYTTMNHPYFQVQQRSKGTHMFHTYTNRQVQVHYVDKYTFIFVYITSHSKIYDVTGVVCSLQSHRMNLVDIPTYIFSRES